MRCKRKNTYDGKNKKKWIIHEKMNKIFRGIKKFQRQMVL